MNPDGSLKWKYGTVDAVWSPPTVDSVRTVYVESNDGKICTFAEYKYCHIDMDKDGFGDPNIPSLAPLFRE